MKNIWKIVAIIAFIFVGYGDARSVASGLGDIGYYIAYFDISGILFLILNIARLAAIIMLIYIAVKGIMGSPIRNSIKLVVLYAGAAIIQIALMFIFNLSWMSFQEILAVCLNAIGRTALYVAIMAVCAKLMEIRMN